MARLISGLIVVAALAGGVLFFFSPYFKDKVTQHYEDLTQWTPEKIAADPAGYLRAAIRQLDDIERDLQGRKLALTTQKSTVEGKLRRDEDAYLPLAVKKLEELKADYRGAEASADWSLVTVGGKSVTQGELQDLILQGDANVSRARKNIQQYRDYLVRVGAEIERTDKLIQELREKRAEVRQSLEHVQLEQKVGDYTALRDRINAVLATTQALRGDTGEQLSFDKLVQAEADTQVGQDRQARFAEIMKRN